MAPRHSADRHLTKLYNRYVAAEHKEKSCFTEYIEFISEDYFVEHDNITTIYNW